MRITNDHYGNFPDSAWEEENVHTVYVTDDLGVTWSVRSDPRGGIEVKALGSGKGDDRISAHATSGNVFTLRASTP